MSTTFVRPGHLHTAGRVLSASTEAGLCVAPPLPATTNKGQLRLRATGTPTGVVGLVAKLQTGGNPFGYATADYGVGAGAAVLWRASTDTADKHRGYSDSIYLQRVEFPLAYSNSLTHHSTPRTLSDGALGWITARPASGNGATFRHLTAAGVLVSTTILGGGATGALAAEHRDDFVVLPSGRLVAFCQGNQDIKSYYSDDNGATWGTLSASAYRTTSAHNVLCVEYVDDMIVLVNGSRTGATSTRVLVSRDGGCTFSLVDNATTLVNPRTCVTKTGKILVSSQLTIGNDTMVCPLAPGGGIGPALAIGTLANRGVEHPIVTRDDGSIWMFSMEVGAANAMDMRAAVSLDGGVTWTDAGGAQDVADFEFTGAAPLIYGASCGTWQGSIVMLLTGGDVTGDDNAVQLWTWGGWASLTEKRTAIATNGQPYEHVYTPIDVPDGVGWTKVVFGAGATVTNQGPLNIVSTGADNAQWRSPAGFFSNAAGETKRNRLRVRVNSGGSITDNRSCVSFVMTDGANEQEVKLRFSATTVRVLDGAGNTLGDIVVDQTGWTDWLVAQRHDLPAPAAGLVTVYYKRDADTFWTAGLTGAAVAEVVGLRNRIEIGGPTGGACNWDVALIATSDDDNDLGDGFTNPDDLCGRPLTTVADYYLASGIHLGGRNGGGVPGDIYTVASTYQYGKESIWRELRPSKKCHSSADNASWNVVFDAGAADVFKGDVAALFGTNFRTATLQLNAADAWGAPSVSVALDATLVTSTVGAGVRGPGYVGPTASLNWRPGQFKSDGDAHRYFLALGENVYEITDNDESRIYVEGVDFSAAAGTFYVYGDKMAATFAWSQYRFMRLLVGAQQTPPADDCYHVGTLIVDKGFTPAQLYDHGFVDRIEPHVELLDTDAGYRSSARLGPRRYTLAIQWPPVATQGPASDLELRLRDFYAALEGSHRPFVFWRDTTDVSSVMLCRLVGTYQASNVWGERSTALTRVDQLVLEECY